MNDYDANGKKIGHSSPSFFGGMNHYDNNGHKVQLINVNSKMRKNLFYFLTKKGRTFPLVKISFFERY